MRAALSACGGCSDERFPGSPTVDGGPSEGNPETGPIVDPCAPPAIAAIVTPEPGASVSGRVALSGWATKDDVPLAEVEVTIDGRHVATARYGRPEPFVGPFMGGASRDPALPNVGFDAEIDVSALAPGVHHLGLVLRDAAGREEPGPQQPIEVVR